MHQTTIFIFHLYFINELLRLKVLVINLQFYLRKRCHKTSCQAEVYAYVTGFAKTKHNDARTEVQFI